MKRKHKKCSCRHKIRPCCLKILRERLQTPRCQYIKRLNFSCPQHINLSSNILGL